MVWGVEELRRRYSSCCFMCFWSSDGLDEELYIMGVCNKRKRRKRKYEIRVMWKLV